MNQIASLPVEIQKEILKDESLIKGIIGGTEECKEMEGKLQGDIEENIKQLKQVKELMKKYEGIDEKIKKKVQKIDELHKEFMSHETIQYQYLSNNFNGEFLKTKLMKAIKWDIEEAKMTIKQVKNGDNQEFGDLLEKFKNQRKSVHLKQEKMNRWNEERVSGFL